MGPRFLAGCWARATLSCPHVWPVLSSEPAAMHGCLLLGCWWLPLPLSKCPAWDGLLWQDWISTGTLSLLLNAKPNGQSSYFHLSGWLVNASICGSGHPSRHCHGPAVSQRRPPQPVKERLYCGSRVHPCRALLQASWAVCRLLHVHSGNKGKGNAQVSR